jgi:hypothetical protein
MTTAQELLQHLVDYPAAVNPPRSYSMPDPGRLASSFQPGLTALRNLVGHETAAVAAAAAAAAAAATVCYIKRWRPPLADNMSEDRPHMMDGNIYSLLPPSAPFAAAGVLQQSVCPRSAADKTCAGQLQ